MSREAFEDWWLPIAPNFDPITIDHVLAAWEAQQARIDELYAQLEQAQADRKHYGVHLAAALKGEKLPSEPVDQRLDKVRELVARNSEAKDLLNQVSLMFLMSGARSDADSHNPIERWMHDLNKWKDGAK